MVKQTVGSHSLIVVYSLSLAKLAIAFTLNIIYAGKSQLYISILELVLSSWLM